MIFSSSASRCFLLAAIAAYNVDAFAPTRLATQRSLPSVKPFRASTLEPTSTTTGPTTWECDEDAQCVEVPACNEEECRTSLDVRIHGDWYDLSG